MGYIEKCLFLNLSTLPSRVHDARDFNPITTRPCRAHTNRRRQLRHFVAHLIVRENHELTCDAIVLQFNV